jgi:inorganic pyrophosphatase
MKHKVRATDYIGKTVTMLIDRPIHSIHPTHGFFFELNYGYVLHTFSPDGEELDAYLIGIDYPVSTFTGTCIAVVHRSNDNDDKLIVVAEGKNVSDEEILKATHFQERFFTVVIRRK